MSLESVVKIVFSAQEKKRKQRYGVGSRVTVKRHILEYGGKSGVVKEKYDVTDALYISYDYGILLDDQTAPIQFTDKELR